MIGIRLKRVYEAAALREYLLARLKKKSRALAA